MSTKAPGCQVAMLALSPLGRFLAGGGLCDFVFVDCVAKDVLRAIVQPVHDPLDVVWATNGIPCGSSYMMRCNPSKSHISASKEWLETLRRLEVWVARVVIGRRASRALGDMYRGYMYFSANTWVFPRSNPAPPRCLATKYISTAKIRERTTPPGMKSRQNKSVCNVGVYVLGACLAITCAWVAWASTSPLSAKR